MGSDLREFVRSNPPKPFKSNPVYSRDGNFLAFFLEDAEYYAHRVDHLLTVYLDMRSRKLVGFKIATGTPRTILVGKSFVEFS